MNNICINCIHKDVCYKYRLNYVSAREGSCNDYLNPDLSKYSDNLWKEAYERGHKEGYKLAILDGKTNYSRGDCKSCKHRDPEDKKCDCGTLKRQYNNDSGIFNGEELLRLHILKSKKTGKLFASYIMHGTDVEHSGLWRITAEIFPEEFDDIKTRLLEISEAEDD